MDDNAGIPEDLRCKRSDGKQWRCNALSMPDKTVCEKHYIQAKKRAANSALRANLKKAKRRSLDHSNYFDDDQDMSMSPSNNTGGGGDYSSPNPRHKGKLRKGHRLYSDAAAMRGGSSARLGDSAEFEENQIVAGFRTPSNAKAGRDFGGNSVGEYYGRNTDSSGDAEGITCHQCRRNDRMRVMWCMSCDRKGYCDSCVARWYADISLDDIRRVCPTCRGICSCVVCRRGDTMIKARIQEVTSINRLQCLHSLLSFALPVLKRIHLDQCSEVDVEKKINGARSDIPRAIINPDEQMCCDICSIPIVDYHRHCTNCSTDLCLHCVRDLRASAKEMHNKRHSDASRDVYSSGRASTARQDDEHLLHYKDNCTLNFSHLYPKWRVNSDGSIPCPDSCCRSSLILRRIFKINWVSKLVKNAEEMVSGCRVSELGNSENCISCSEMSTTQPTGLNGDHFLYSPASEDIRHETVAHFSKHWIKGEPIIVRQVIDGSLASIWDPKSIWKGIQEIAHERIIEDNPLVKAINCSTNFEIDIKLEEFIRGYSEGRICEDNTPEILTLKDWPQPDALEDFLLCQRPEILTRLPLLEYIHPRWGLLNLAAKLPHDTLQTDAGPKLCIAYGSYQGQRKGDSVMNLKVNMIDTVHLLIHTSEVKFRYKERHENDKNSKTLEESFGSGKENDAYAFDVDMHKPERGNMSDSPPNERSEMRERFSSLAREGHDAEDNKIFNGTGVSTVVQETGASVLDKGFEEDLEKDYAGVIWDIFPRQDIHKLNQYLRVHSDELRIFNNSFITEQVKSPVFDQAYFLNKDHKRKLKEEFGIEPWTLKQHLGEAVFIPAGCAFQVRNLKSAVQLVLDFLSPESLAESMYLAQEIRCLPNDHIAKLQMLEVMKMPLYAASWAIREIQKITLDPKVASELGFEDRNLTAKVLDNLQRMIKRNQVACI